MTPDQIRNQPHSGLCDAGTIKWVPASEYEPEYYRAVVPLCTCGAGLLKLLAGGR